MPTIQGKITDSPGVAIANIEVAARGPLHGHKEKLELNASHQPPGAFTDAAGVFTITVTKKGWYEIIPQDAIKVFEPMSKMVLVDKNANNVTGVNFTSVVVPNPLDDDTPHPRPTDKDRKDLVMILDTLTSVQHEVALMWYQGHDAQEIWDVVRKIVCRSIPSFESAPPPISGGSGEGSGGCGCSGSDATADSKATSVNVACTTCWNRYYTPGTPYYMNYTALQQCLNSPCT